MGRNVSLGIGLFALVVLAGWYVWFRPSDNLPPTTDDTIRVVADSGATGRRSPSAPQPAATAGAPAGTVDPIDDPAASGIPDDPKIEATLMDPSFDPRAMYRRIRSEPRDKAWAARSEARIQAGLIQVPYLERGKALRVSCASTLCEVRGSTVPGAPADNVNVAMQKLQGEDMKSALAANGLEIVSASFGGGATDATHFTMYAKRR